MGKLKDVSRIVIIGYALVAATATAGFMAYGAYQYWKSELIPNPVEQLETTRDAGVESKLIPYESIIRNIENLDSKFFEFKK